MSAALEFRKCKSLLLSSLAVIPQGFGCGATRVKHGEALMQNKKTHEEVSLFGVIAREMFELLIKETADGSADSICCSMSFTYSLVTWGTPAISLKLYVMTILVP